MVITNDVAGRHLLPREMEKSIKIESDKIDEELLLRQVTELVVNQRLLAGRSLPEDKIVRFVHPHELKVSFHLHNVTCPIT